MQDLQSGDDIDESHRRITLLPEKFTEANKMDIKEMYMKHGIVAELSLNEANALLVRSSPNHALQKSSKQPLPANPVQTIMVYPPPPAKGGISINTEDYSCLAEDVFLNDVIIDFYLKYLYLRTLSEEDRQKTHIFSSFFYKRLTDKATPVSRNLQNSKSGDSITPAEIRHSRVKNWTKNIDIFSKDYIVIPLNENQHWFLAIICFPGLKGPVRFCDNLPIEVDSTDKVTVTEETDNKRNQIDNKSNVTLSQASADAKAAFCVDDDNDVEDRDEADGADEDVNFFSTSSDNSENEYSENELTEEGEMKPKIKKAEREPIKQPCILIFDSLAGASRARIIATLRDYLRVEYKVKHGEERDFSKNVVKGACPKVPQQTNYTDCGLYVLQYVENFFTDKITDFRLPIKTLREWFSSRLVSSKRYFIQQILHELMNEQHINIENLHLPNLHLSPRSLSYEDSDEFERELDMHYYEDFEYDVDEMEEHARYNSRIIDDDDDDDIGDELDEEDGCEFLRRTNYEIYNSTDDDDVDGDSDDLTDNELYNDLDNEYLMRAKNHEETVKTRIRNEDYDNDEDAENDNGESEDMNAENDEQFANINKVNVTISRMSSSSSSANCGGSDNKNRQTSNAKDLAELKAFRLKPWEQMKLDNQDNECSTKKKFRTS